MTRVAKLKIYEAPRSQTREEARETFLLAWKEYKEHLTLIEQAQALVEIFGREERQSVLQHLDDLRKGRYC